MAGKNARNSWTGPKNERLLGNSPTSKGCSFHWGVSLDDAIHVRRDIEDASVDLTVDFRPGPTS